jgi:hypothetical protein
MRQHADEFAFSQKLPADFKRLDLGNDLDSIFR